MDTDAASRDAPAASPEQRLIRRLARWLAIDPGAASGFQGYCRVCRYATGDTLFRLGDAADEAVLLETGLVRAFYVLRDREVNLRLLAAPAIALPFHSFLREQPADETLQALTPVSGLRMRFRAYCREHPGLLAERLRRHLAEAHFISLQRRLRMLQGRSATQRYAFFLAEMEPEIVAGTPGYHVASYLGITSESLSRLRHPRP